MSFMSSNYRFGYGQSIPFRLFPETVMRATIPGMDSSSYRTAHMRRIVAAAGGPAGWIREYGGTRWQQAQVSQWISESNPKGIGRKLARDLEAAMGLAVGALDQPDEPASQSAGLDLARLATASQFLEDLFRTKGKVFVASEQVHLLAAVYDDLSRPSASTIVELALKFGPMLDGGGDGRQGTPGGASADDRAGNRARAGTAGSKARKAG